MGVGCSFNISVSKTAPAVVTGRRRSVAKFSAEFLPKGRIIRLKQFFEDRTQPSSLFRFHTDRFENNFTSFYLYECWFGVVWWITNISIFTNVDFLYYDFILLLLFRFMFEKLTSSADLVWGKSIIFFFRKHEFLTWMELTARSSFTGWANHRIEICNARWVISKY